MARRGYCASLGRLWEWFIDLANKEPPRSSGEGEGQGAGFYRFGECKDVLFKVLLGMYIMV